MLIYIDDEFKILAFVYFCYLFIYAYMNAIISLS